MKTKEWQELKNKPAVELRKKLADFRENLRKMKFDLAAGKVKNIKEIGKTKKSIARILGLINASREQK